MCRCGNGNIKLRKSHKNYSYGRLFYSCPLSKVSNIMFHVYVTEYIKSCLITLSLYVQPSRKEYGCKYFMWKDEFDEYYGFSSSNTSPGPTECSSSGPTDCSKCKFKDLKINMLETKIKMLEAKLELAMNPDNHACMSGALLNELLESVENLSV